MQAQVAGTVDGWTGGQEKGTCLRTEVLVGCSSLPRSQYPPTPRTAGTCQRGRILRSIVRYLAYHHVLRT